MKKLAVLCLILISVFACNKYRSQEIKVEAKQNGFDSMSIGVFRESDDKRIYLVDKEVRIVIMDREISARTDNRGRLIVNVPVEMATRLDKITLIIEGHPYDVSYMRKKVFFKRSVEYQAISYKRIVFQVSQIRLEESAPGSELVEVGKHPFEGKVVIQLSGEFGKVKYTGDGKIDLVLEEDEMNRFVDQPDLVINFEDGHIWTGRVKLPPLTGKVEIKEPIQNDDCFVGVLVNGTFETAKVTLRAGYVRHGEEWFIGKVLSTKYFAESEYELEPGEMKKVELSYHKPLIGEKQLKYKLYVQSENAIINE